MIDYLEQDFDNDDVSVLEQLISEMFSPVLGEGDIGQPVTRATSVFRIEMPNGHGPFNSGLGNEMEIYETLANLHCADFARDTNEQCGRTEAAFHEAHGDAEYACKSMYWLKKWFNPASRQYLVQYNAVLKEYSVLPGDCILEIANGEVVFSRKDAQLIATYELTSLEKVS